MSQLTPLEWHCIKDLGTSFPTQMDLCTIFFGGKCRKWEGGCRPSPINCLQFVFLDCHYQWFVKQICKNELDLSWCPWKSPRIRDGGMFALERIILSPKFLSGITHHVSGAWKGKILSSYENYTTFSLHVKFRFFTCVISSIR